MKSPVPDVDECNVFVKFLPCEYTERDLFNLFQPYGDIVNTKVMINTKTGTSLGYGFVRFSDPAEAREAIAKMNRVQIGYKVLLCKLSKPIQTPTINPFSLLDDSELRDPSPTIYVRILSPTITDAMLRAAFAPFGEIQECQVHIDSVSGKSKRSGYIKYSTIEEATSAIHSMKGSLQLGETPLIVKYANGRLSQKSTSPQPVNILNQSLSNLNNNNNNNSTILLAQINNLASSTGIDYYYESPHRRSVSPQPSSSPPQQHSPRMIPVVPQQQQQQQQQQPTQIPPHQYTYLYAPPHHQDIYIYHPHYYATEYTISPPRSPSPPASPTHYPTTPSQPNFSNRHHPYYIYAPHHHPTYTYHHHQHQQPPMEFSTIDIDNPNSTTLICTYNEDIEFSDLYETFSNYGSLQSLKINKSGEGKFQSIITFTNVDHAVNAKHCLDRSKIGSQRIRIEYDEVFCL
ncbi:hypothetical protein PPL_02412 [Heterostelium album PN500]|uniref:RRM domain-containing protein n=1 Tax=Heterostelium pallidum (strain ATCC 26659 / Pp 5 / PN500) TaxID=670386 RepID=D3AZN0_HETP5|nr:hypothetical protein PPL_02412 [Heterostelium album PN500]EFA85409.1 hypothetical protein PPL_02412 [Heterostelium album PN500]|eukprot:XP_020437518.1 hypothetical protein PPL_02412 [Heterostelium album PN500]